MSESMNYRVQIEPSVTRCCFWIPLRTGCIILGYLNLVSTLLSIIATITVTTILGYATNGFNHFDVSKEVEIQSVPQFSESSQQTVLFRIAWFITIILFTNFVWVIINAAWLIEVHKKRSGFFRVFISLASLRLIVIIIGNIYLLHSYGSFSLVTSIFEIINFVLTAYFIQIYSKYVKHMENEEFNK
ncbi:uncharacterized protein LOC131854594 [Achroia grisella]|uniref:uncharacterized protein LOC131854594 n=1 Tax=Achroia grisella TaxID=688607 RepID=UPI0027D2A08D|nr:uncharacterized protein LOC131854594 [Achroia grisella]